MTAADDNVDVVNMSLGGYDWFQNPEYATKDTVADVQMFNRAIKYAIQKGVTVVGSAGNNAVDLKSPGQLSGSDTGATHRSPSSQLMIRVSAGGALKILRSIPIMVSEKLMLWLQEETWDQTMIQILERAGIILTWH